MVNCDSRKKAAASGTDLLSGPEIRERNGYKCVFVQQSFIE